MDYLRWVLILIIAGLVWVVFKLSNEKKEVKLAKREAEGKVKQMGKTGHYAYYIKA